MNANEYEQKVYKVLKVVLKIPDATVQIVANICGIELKELCDILVYIDDKKEFSEEAYIPDWDWMDNYMMSLPYNDRI